MRKADYRRSTSPLVSPCESCKEDTHHPQDANGFYLQIKRSLCDECENKKEREDREKEEKELLNRKEFVQRNCVNIAIRTGMPSVFRDANKNDFKKSKADMIDFIANDLCRKSNWNNQSYILYGDTGTGKSYMTALIYMLWICDNWRANFNPRKSCSPCSWASLQDLTSLTKAEKDISKKESLVYDIALRPSFLVFEFGDVGSEGSTYSGRSNYVLNLFQSIVDHRWKYTSKRTIWITRLGKYIDLYDHLTNHYDEATVGRLLQHSQPIKVTGKNFRKEDYRTKNIWEI